MEAICKWMTGLRQLCRWWSAPSQPIEDESKKQNEPWSSEESCQEAQSWLKVFKVHAGKNRNTSGSSSGANRDIIEGSKGSRFGSLALSYTRVSDVGDQGLQRVSLRQPELNLMCLRYTEAAASAACRQSSSFTAPSTPRKSNAVYVENKKAGRGTLGNGSSPYQSRHLKALLTIKLHFPHFLNRLNPGSSGLAFKNLFQIQIRSLTSHSQ